MLMLQNGAVVPHVNPGTLPNHVSVHQFTGYVRRGATLDSLLKDCWGRGFSAYDSILVASVNGYGLCVAEPRRRVVWGNLDVGWKAHCDEYADLSDDDKRNIEWE